MKKYEVGQRFVAKNNFPEDITEEVENEMASFDIMEGEKFEIVEVNEHNEYKVFNISLDNVAWCLMTEEELDYTIGK